MSKALDADIHLLEVRDGAVQPASSPGLLARAAPRRCARGRESDFLCLALALITRESVSSSRLGQLVELAAKMYFGTPGSVTSALREAAAAVNERLLQYNVRGAATGEHVQGSLAIVVLRKLDLYLGQCGPALTLVVHPAVVERFPAGEARARPLGIGQAAGLQYFHTRAAPGDLLVLNAAPPIPWESDDFSSLAGATLDRALTRLVDAANAGGAAFSALVAQFIQPASTPAEGLEPAVESRPPMETGPSLRPARALPPASRPSVPPEAPALAPTRRPRRPPSAKPAPQLASPEAEPLREVLEKEEGGPAPSLGQRLARFNPGRPIRAMLRATGVTLVETYRGLRVFMARLLPEGMLEREGLFTLPSSLLLALAVAIPLVVVAVVSVVYFQRGRTEQFQHYLAEAQAEMSAARTQPDLIAARPHYEDALRSLARAEEYARTDETVKLYLEAQGALDRLDGVTRLNFRAAVLAGFGKDARLIALIVGDRNLYALDATANAVRMARPNTVAFDYDSNFSCSPQAITSLTVGTLVDMAWLPGRSALPGVDAALIVFDQNGTVLYCAPDVPPLAAHLAEPEGGWMRPVAIDLFADRLYVLDPGGSEIWLYDSQNGVFNQRPSRYFTSISYDLTDVIDFAIAQGDVYLLHADGTLTGCARAGVQDVAQCAEVIFVDGRTGRSDGPTIDGAVPSRLVHDPPPEPSLYFVDTLAGGVYQYSLRQVFQRQFRSLNELPDTGISAVAIGPNKEIYIAVGSNVYFSGR